MNKLKYPSLNYALCEVQLKFALWFWRRSWKCKTLQTDRQAPDKKWSIRVYKLGFLHDCFWIIGLHFIVTALLMHACLTVTQMLCLFHMFYSLLTSVFTSMFPLSNDLHACLTFLHANLTEVLSMCKILPDSSAQNNALSSSRPIAFESRVPFFTWNR